MGNWNRKNYLLIIKLRDNITDQRYVEFIRGWNFTNVEWGNFILAHQPIYHPLSADPP